MVRPETRRSDDELGPVTDRTGQVEGRVVCASSRGLRDTTEFRWTHLTAMLTMDDFCNPSSDAGLGRDSSTSGDGDRTRFMSTMIKITGSRQKRPEKLRPPTNPTQRKKAKNDDWEQTGPTDGGLQNPVLISSNSGHIAGSIWRGQSDMRITNSSVGINGQDLAQVAESPGSRLSTELRTAYYVQYLLGSSLFIDKSDNNVLGKLWLLVKDVFFVGGFAWGLDILVFSYVFPSGETGSEVVQAVYPKVCDVGTQNGAQINRHPHSFRLDDRRRGQVDSVQARGDN
ncbi:hypothetical protein M9H77_27967 [Catharanthus roseus]|uniref:Uncharacterized protein n=1 Tax=Catharanthus roseus TaxID=4058 RepID=A0ACC0AG84_CATRO|nr:hypothetical protein M9H77_27967 [Catharanthus roseus]